MGHPLLVQQKNRQSATVGGRPAWKMNWGVSKAAVAAFTRNFAVMLKARLPLVEALTMAAESTKQERLRQVLLEVTKGVRHGRSLSQGLAAHPRVFSTLYVHLVRVGEATGLLPDILDRLGQHLEKAQALKRKVRLAMLYPATILLVAFGAAAFLLTSIVPAFADMFRDFGAELPGPTRFVLQLSQALTTHALVVLLATFGFVGVCLAVSRTPAGRFWGHRLVLRVPVFGALVRKGVLARFCRTLGTLLNSGVALVEALDLLTHTLGNVYVAQALKEVTYKVQRGSSLHQPLQQTGLFPPMAMQMIAVGERTAALDTLLLQAATHYEDEVDAFVESLTTLIEPVLILVVGGLLGGLIAAMYLPIFDLVNVVG